MKELFFYSCIYTKLEIAKSAVSLRIGIVLRAAELEALKTITFSLSLPSDFPQEQLNRYRLRMKVF
jgi:hypothetical protein